MYFESKEKLPLETLKLFLEASEAVSMFQEENTASKNVLNETEILKFSKKNEVLKEDLDTILGGLYERI